MRSQLTTAGLILESFPSLLLYSRDKESSKRAIVFWIQPRPPGPGVSFRDHYISVYIVMNLDHRAIDERGLSGRNASIWPTFHLAVFLHHGPIYLVLCVWRYWDAPSPHDVAWSRMIFSNRCTHYIIDGEPISFARPHIHFIVGRDKVHNKQRILFDTMLMLLAFCPSSWTVILWEE